MSAGATTGEAGGELSLEGVGAPRTEVSRWSDYVALTKPRITLMVAVTAALGYATTLSGAAGGNGWGALVSVLVGVVLACMGSAALNQAYEREADARMHRTRRRPVAAGRMSTGEGIVVGLVLSLVGVGVIWVGCGPAAGPLAAGLTALTVASYAFVYTPMKRATALALYVGAIPGAMPPLIGAAGGGEITAAAWLLFGVMVVWQVPHFLAIAWVHREDYGRGGFPMLTVTDPEGRMVVRRVVGGALLLVFAGPIGVATGAFGWVAGLALAAVGGWFAWESLGMARKLDAASARRVFLMSLLYLPVALGVIVAGAWWAVL